MPLFQLPLLAGFFTVMFFLTLLIAPLSSTIDWQVPFVMFVGMVASWGVVVKQGQV